MTARRFGPAPDTSPTSRAGNGRARLGHRVLGIGAIGVCIGLSMGSHDRQPASSACGSPPNAPPELTGIGFYHFSSVNPGAYPGWFREVGAAFTVHGPALTKVYRPRIDDATICGLDVSPLQQVIIAPAAVTLEPGQSQTFTASGVFPGNVVAPIPASFIPQGGTVVGGTYTAGTSAGTFLVVAKATGSTLSDTATVTITSPWNGAVDRVLLKNNSWHGDPALPVGMETATLLDGTPLTGACLKDDFRTTNLTWPNLIAPKNCRDEVAVFSMDDPVVIDTSDAGPGGIWTAASGETRTEDLAGGRNVVRLAIWLANKTTGNFTTNDCAPVTVHLNDVIKASDLYNANRTGVVFQVVQVKDLCKDKPALDALKYTPGPSTPAEFDCPNPHTHPPAPASYMDSVINVYYVHALRPNIGLGIHCSVADSNLILVSVSNHKQTTLAHELGHAFSLQHTNDGVTEPWPSLAGSASYEWYPGEFTGDNIMWSGRPGERSTFSLGQVFRVVVDEVSLLNIDHFRTGPTRRCAGKWETVGPTGTSTLQAFLTASDTDGLCPRISRGWQ